MLNFKFLLQNFRDQRIDGSGLPLLTEEHLTSTMNMKLGPALKLRSILAKKIGSCSVCLHCTHCHNATGSPDPSNNTGNTSDSGGGNSWKHIFLADSNHFAEAASGIVIDSIRLKEFLKSIGSKRVQHCHSSFLSLIIILLIINWNACDFFSKF